MSTVDVDGYGGPALGRRHHRPRIRPYPRGPPVQHQPAVVEDGDPAGPGQGEVLGDGEVREDPLPLGNQADTGPGHPVRGPAGQHRPGEPDAPTGHRYEPGDGVYQRGLSGAVRADDGRDAADRYVE